MSGRTAVHGLHAVAALLRRQPSAVQELLVLRGRADRRLKALRDQAAALGIPCREAERRELDGFACAAHQGVIALAAAELEQPPLDERGLLELLAERGENALLLVLDSVTDPHNLGACLRSADAAGVDALAIPANQSARINATVRKVASGAAETVPLVTVTNLARLLARLKRAGIWVVGTEQNAKTTIFQQHLTGPVAIVLGAEGKGMRRLVREQCDFLAAIPMAGELSSLNVSVAAGICLFEAVRQRSTQA